MKLHTEIASSDQAEANKEIVRRFIAAMNARELEALDELVAPHVVRHCPSTPDVVVRNLDDFKAFLHADLASVPDALQEIQLMLAERDLVALWANYSGTQRGAFGPFPPSGRPISIEFAAILRIEDGKIAEIWIVWDNFGALVQLGHLRPPGG